MSAERIRRVQCPERLLLAGFQLIIIGRFWVIAEVAENASSSDPPKLFNQIRGNEVSKLGWTLVRTLGAGRVQNYHPRDIREYLELSAEQPLAQAYSVLLWYIENPVSRYSTTDQAPTFLRPMFTACVVGSQLAGQIAGQALIRMKALKLQSRTLSASRSLLITPNSKEDSG